VRTHDVDQLSASLMWCTLDYSTSASEFQGSIAPKQMQYPHDGTECNNSCNVCYKSQRMENSAATAPGSSQADTSQNLHNSKIRASWLYRTHLLLTNLPPPDSGRDIHTENHNNSKTYSVNTTNNYNYNLELGSALANAGAKAIAFGSGSFIFSGITYWVSDFLPSTEARLDPLNPISPTYMILTDHERYLPERYHNRGEDGERDV
jgi:hypothetical protein